MLPGKKTFTNLFLKHQREGEEKKTDNCQVFCVTCKRK